MADIGVSVWESPPPRSRGPGSGQWAPYIRELIAHPEKWGRLSKEFETPRDAQTVAANLRASAPKTEAWMTEDNWSFVSRTPEADGGDRQSYVWGSFWPDGKPEDVRALEAAPRKRKEV